MSLRDTYVEKCRSLQIKPNSQVVKMLPDDSSLKALDLSDNIIGHNGALAVIEVVRAAKGLAHLCLKGNNITSQSAKEVCCVLREHGSIEEVDLSNNDIRLAGPELVDLVKKNANIKRLCLSETYVRPLFTNLISMQLKRNETRSKPTNAGIEKTKKEEELAKAGEKDTTKDKDKDKDKDVGTESGSRPASSVAKSVEFGEAVVQDLELDPSEESEGDPFDRRMSAEESFQVYKAFGEDASTSPRAKTPEYEPLKKVASRRPTVCAEAYSEEQIDNFKPVVTPKDPPVRDFLLTVLEKNQLFNHLDDYELMTVIDALVEVQRAKGDMILEQGDEDMDCFYVVGVGEVAIKVDGIEVKTLSRGDSFGDVFLLYPQDSPETVMAEEESTLYAFDRRTFKFILNQASKKKRAMYEGFLQKVPFLSTLSHLELLQLADALKSSQYNDGDYVIQYGEEGTWLHIVVEGTLCVIGRDERGEKVKVCEFTAGACVGELEFLNNHKTVADVIARGKVRTAKTNRRHFEMCMGPVLDILRKNADKLEVYAYYRETLSKIKEQ